MVYGSPILTSSSPFLDGFTSNTLTWVIAGVAAYWLVLVVLRQRDLLPEYIGAQGPILTIHTKRGRDFLDQLSRPKRFWRAWANFGIGTAVVVMVAMFVVMITAAISALQTTEPTAVQQPRNALAIPGVNDFLPLSVAPEILAGLLVGLVVHEGGHGLLCRVEDIEIESMGVAMLAILPIGAFVEPEEESSRAASRGAQTRMFAAGVTNNFAVSVVTFALLFWLVAGSIAVAPGAAVGGVVAGSPADDVGIEPNDRITALEGESIASNDDFEDRLEEAGTGEVALELNDGRTVTVDRSLLVTTAIEADHLEIESGDTIIEVNGESVTTERGFFEAMGDDDFATITVRPAGGGDSVDHRIPIGASVLIADGPFAAAGPSVEESIIVTRFDGDRVRSSDDLEEKLGDVAAGDEVTIVGYQDGERVEYDVTLGEHPQTGGAYLGVFISQGVSGFTISDLGIQQLYPASLYLSLMGGTGGDGYAGLFGDSFLERVGIALLLPFASALQILPFDFAGFTGGIQNFYSVTGPLSVLGDDAVFVLANALFWTGWINVMLGFFNCIPAFPLDGGHILRTSTEAVLSRLPFDVNRGMVRVVTTSVGITMLVSFMLMLFAPTLLTG